MSTTEVQKPSVNIIGEETPIVSVKKANYSVQYYSNSDAESENNDSINPLHPSQRNHDLPPPATRFSLILLGFVHCWLCSGIVLGFPAYMLLLINEKVYASKCPPDAQLPCKEQEFELELIYAAGIVALNFSAIIGGPLLDRLGPKITSVIFSFIHAVGVVLLCLSDDTKFPAYIPGFICCAVGGPMIHLSVFHLSNLFPRWSQTIQSINAGLYSASSLLFFIFLEINQQFKISTRVLFLCYLPLVVFVMLSAFACWPMKCYVQTPEQYPLIISSRSLKKSLHFKPFFKQVGSPDALYMMIFISICVLRLNFFQGTMDAQLLGLGDKQTHYAYIQAFSFIAPFGFLVTPIFGFVLDCAHVAVSILILNLIAVAMNALIIVPNLQVQIATFVLFAVQRPFIYAVSYSYVSKIFGFHNFGKLIAVCNVFVGFANVIEFGLFGLVKNVFRGKHLYINVALLVLGILFFHFPLFVWVKGRKRMPRSINFK